MQTLVKIAEDNGCGRRIKPNPRKLTIEQYLDFIHSHRQLDLNVLQLQQIIDMHGFNRIPSSKKSFLTEIVKSLELMDLYRSTVEADGISTSDAFLSLHDVINGLNELKWHECSVTSIQTLSSANLHHQHGSGGGSLETGGQGSVATTETSIVSAASVKGKTKRSRRKFQKVAETTGSKESVSSGTME